MPVCAVMARVTRIPPASAFLAAALALTAPCHAQSWQVDPDFAPRFVNLGPTAQALRVSPLSDGRILVRGAFNLINDQAASSSCALLRHDGAVDAFVSLVLPETATLDFLVPLPDGRWFGIHLSTEGSWPTTLRLLADGTLDRTFRPATFPQSSSSFARRYVPLPNGQFLLAGSFTHVDTASRFTLARFNADGTFDPTFDPGFDLFSRVTGLSVGPDGAVFAAVDREARTPATGVAHETWRLRADGSRDPAFNAPAGARFATTLAVQADGRVLVANQSDPLVRLNADGTRDASFVWRGSGERITHVVALPNGRIAATTQSGTVLLADASGTVLVDANTLVASNRATTIVGLEATGDILICDGPRTSRYAPSIQPPGDVGPIVSEPALLPESTIRRLRSNGTLDPAFAFRPAVGGSINAVARDASGRILVAGDFDEVNGESAASGIARGFVRLRADGTRDATFNPALRPSRIWPLANGQILIKRVTLASLPGPIVGVSAPVSQTGYFRLNADGSRDTTYQPAGDPLWINEDGTAIGGRFVSAQSSATDIGYRLVRYDRDGAEASVFPAAFGISPNVVTVDGRRPSPISKVRELADGRLMIAGPFVSVNGVARSGLARLNADGTLDPSYSATGGEAVELLNNGRVLVGTWSPTSIPRRLQADGRDDPTFVAEQPLSIASVNEGPDGSMLLGDARLQPSGTRDWNFPPTFGALREYYTGLSFASVADALADGQSAIASSDGTLYLAGAFTIVDGAPRTGLVRLRPVEVAGITRQPASRSVLARSEVTFSVAHGLAAPASYQWSRNGVPIPGATGASLTIAQANFDDAGEYRVAVTVRGQTFVSTPALLSIRPLPPRLANISARAFVAPGSPLICGFVSTSLRREFLLRAIGPALTPLGVPGVLPDTQLLLRQPSGLLLATAEGNARSFNDLAQRLGGFPVGATSSGDSALDRTLGQSAYTAEVRSPTNRSGVALFELYDAAPPSEAGALKNASARARVGVGGNALFVGFVVDGQSQRVLIRGIGPALGALGLADALADPQLVIHALGRPNPIASNSGWAGSPEIAETARRVGAFPLNANSRDTAVILTLEPGVYTAQLTSTSGAEGSGLIELYVVED